MDTRLDSRKEFEQFSDKMVGKMRNRRKNDILGEENSEK